MNECINEWMYVRMKKEGMIYGWMKAFMSEWMSVWMISVGREGGIGCWGS